ncbi:MAG: DciA family protein [Pseudomonadota bacterium]
MAKTGNYERNGSFKRASSVVERRIRQVGETRGFAVTRLLTHWSDIVGQATAETARPVNVSYAKRGLGATLTLLTSAAHAPMLQMRLPEIREKVNACYGYNAIARIRITQTAATGFAEGRADFSPAPKPSAARAGSPADPALTERASRLAAGVSDDALRQALTDLGENVMRTSKRTS